MEHRIAGPADLQRAAETLGRSFFHDPVWSWVFPDPDRRLHQLTELWGLTFRGSVEYRWVWTTDSCEAVAVWIPPGMPEIAAPVDAEFEPLIEELAGPRAPLVHEVFDRFEAAHPDHEPHHYLSLFGTHPDHRGGGIGMDLLRASLAAIDRDHEPAYLESSNPANLARYESVGFVQIGSFDLPDDGPSLTRMWRDAA